jgi:hypothetical protein
MMIPEAWRGYDCGDYFSSELAEHGWWDDGGSYWYIEPADRLAEDGELHLLIIGGPGVDLIRWGYRKGHPGIWAHYPMEQEWRLVAQSAPDLRDGYASGRILV